MRVLKREMKWRKKVNLFPEAPIWCFKQADILVKSWLKIVPKITLLLF